MARRPTLAELVEQIEGVLAGAARQPGLERVRWLLSARLLLNRAGGLWIERIAEVRASRHPQIKRLHRALGLRLDAAETQVRGPARRAA